MANSNCSHTCSIIVYHQPVTRAEIEEIRGVAFGTNTLEILMELDWVKPGGRKMFQVNQFNI